MIFLRQKYKEKPKQYGPASEVQSSIFQNAEWAGIDPGIIVDVMGLYPPGEQRSLIENISGSLLNTPKVNGNKFAFTDHRECVSYTSYGDNIQNFGSVIFTYRKSDTSANQYLYFYHAGPSYYSFACFADQTNNRLYVYTNDLSDLALIDDSAALGYLLDGQEHTIVCTWDDRGGINIKTVSIDNKYTGSDTSAWDLASLSGYSLSIGSRPDSDNRYCGGEIGVLSHVSEILTPGQKDRLSNDRYFLLHRVAPVFYSIPQTVTFKPFWALNATRISL